MRRLLVGLGFLAACVVDRTEPVPTPATLSAHVSPVTSVRADRADDGTVIVSQVAGGELAGLVTLTLYPTTNGRYVGEWALMVAHADNTDPATGLEPPTHSHVRQPSELGAAPHRDLPHKDFVRFVHRGALFGIVTDASLTFDARGALADLSAKLSVDQGTQEFNGAAGTGRITLANLELGF